MRELAGVDPPRAGGPVAAMPRRAALRAGAWMAGGALFILLATANGVGYRYGTSDQAFYVPAVLRALDPSAFPRDAMLIDAQARLMVLDEALAALMVSTGLPLTTLFLGGYVLSMLLLWAAVVLVGRRLATGPWGIAALGAALTLRHRIPRTSANSLEPYFHPRMLAFSLGALAVAAILRRRSALAVALVGAAAVVHVTTALWFAVLIGTAILVLEPSLRKLLVPAAVVGAVVVGWALAAGPLSPLLVRMDPTWLRALASKDSLFPWREWPAWAWAANLGMAVVLLGIHRFRERRGHATPEDRALVAGAIALVAVFLATLPGVESAVALLVQLQISRVFWLVDFVTTIYVVAALARTFRPAAARALAVGLVLLASGRGIYVMTVEHPERALFAVSVPESAWTGAMRWVSSQPVDLHVLADPGHAWKHGTSVRVSGGRDVLLEEVKDSAVAIYSREVAVRVLERTAAIGRFEELTEEQARALAARFDLDVLVTPARLDLPLAFRNEGFFIYKLDGRRTALARPPSSAVIRDAAPRPTRAAPSGT